MSQRPDVLIGSTHRIAFTLPEGPEVRFYVTINSIDTGTEFKPWEVFVNVIDSSYWEHLVAVTLMMSRLLQAGVPPETIAKDLMGIHSPRTGHMAKGRGWVASLYARVGEVLLEEVKTGPRPAPALVVVTPQEEKP